VGHNKWIITHSWASGDVTGDAFIDGAGGLIGQNWYGLIKSCWASGDVVGYDDRTGGLIGEGSGWIYRCYATGDVTGGNETGGLMGICINGLIKDCYAQGDVSGADKVGGLIGYNFGMDVNDCYSTGHVSGTTNRGGLVGDTSTGGTTNRCFWDVESSGTTVSDGGTGKTTFEMMERKTFEGAGWDLETTWEVEATVRMYPYLHMYLPADLNHDGIVNAYDLGILCNLWLGER